MFQHTDRFSSNRNRMANRHHIDSNAGIKPVHLSYLRHFVCRQAYPHRKQWVLSVSQKTDIQYRRLQKCSKASGYDLLAPAVKAVCVAPRNSEHIQASHCYLTQHYAASLDVRKHDLYRAVTEKYDKKQAEK